MPQRQQMPLNWFIPPGQMGPYQQPPFNPMMNRPMGSMGQMRARGPMGQMGRFGMNQGRQGGGLLAKILGKNPPQMSGFPGFYPMAQGAARGGSFLQNLTNPTAISGFLNNTQQVLRAAQQIGPMVQQYGPLVRNLPAMWRLYKGLKDSDATEDVNDIDNNESSEADVQDEYEEQTDADQAEMNSDKTVHYKNKSEKNNASAKRKRKIPKSIKKSGESIPKLFI